MKTAKNKKTERLFVRLPEGLKSEIEQLSLQMGVSISDIIRMAARQYLDQWGAQLTIREGDR